MLKKKLNKKGFSLIELIIVIAIMAILAAIIVPTVINKVSEANESAAATEAQNLANAIQQEIIELSVDPDADTTYVASVSGTTITLKGGNTEADANPSITGSNSAAIKVTVKKGSATYTYYIDSKGKITETDPTSGT